MTYNFMKNGCADGFKRYKWSQFGRCQASQASAAIDEVGRLFTWGRNQGGQCGQGDYDPEDVGGYGSSPQLIQIELATQIGTQTNWLKASAGEISMMALNSLGEIWCWGEGSYADFSNFGLPDQAPTAVFWLPTQGNNSKFWINIAHDYYCTLAVDVNGDLYSFGMNFDYNLGIGGVPGNNYATPQLVSTITDPVVMIDSEYTAKCAVTSTNKVYIWGTDWWLIEGYVPFFSSQTPKQVTGLPASAQIVDMSVSPLGVYVVLSDGSLWAAGGFEIFGDDGVGYPSGSSTFQQVTGLSSKFITKIRASGMGWSSAIALDSDGNAWFWDDYAEEYNGSSLVPANEYIWSLFGAEFEGEHKWIDVMNNTHQKAYQAIDEYGFLYTWGSQYWGPHLAINAAYQESYYDIMQQDFDSIVTFRSLLGLASEAYEADGDRAYLNNIDAGESAFLHPYVQDEFHRPCGHWHVREFEETDEYAKNCWMPSLSLDGSEVFFVAAGKHMHLDEETGCEIYFFTHDMDANTWELLYTQLDINAANFPGGTAVDGGVYMFSNYKWDASGDRLNETFTNPKIGIWVYRSSIKSMQYTEYSAPEQYMQNKVGCHSSGVCAFAYEDAAGQLLVEVSTDFGATWANKDTIAANPNRLDWSLVVDDNGYIYLAYQTGTSTFALKKSINNGTSWTTPTATQAIESNTTKLKLVKDNSELFIFSRSEDASTYLRSTTETSWIVVIGEDDYVSITASGCNVADGKYSYAINAVSSRMYNLLYDEDADDYLWFTRDVGGYLPTGYTEVQGGLVGTIGQMVDDLFETLLNKYNSQYQSDLNGDNGRFAFSSFNFYAYPVAAVVIAVSNDRGESWSIHQTPLKFFSSIDELTIFDGNPRDWAERFVKQPDKYEHWNGL